MTRTRIAPSPTGMPHIGTLFQALIDYAIAKKNQGSFLVRIEDTDRTRFVEGAEAAIYQSFAWAGITPDESPAHGGKYGPYRQSERLDLYQKYAEQLIDQSKAYYCFCSAERLDSVRKAMQAAGQPPMYDKHCRQLDPTEAKARAQVEPHVVRMVIPENQTISIQDEIRGQIDFDSNVVDDQVLIKSDGFPTYHLAVVVDDHLMEISHVVRGEEWISSAPKHDLLYRYFNWTMPKLIHTPLLRNPNKSKLSKRHGHASVSWYIEQGYLPQAVVNFLITRVWNHPEGIEVFGLDEIVKHFDVHHMHIQGPIVDLDKLNWLNGQWIRRLSNQELLTALKPYQPADLSDDQLVTILPLIKDRLERLSQLTELTSYFYQTPAVDSQPVLKQSKLPEAETVTYLNKVKETLASINDWSVETIESSLRQLQEAEHLKPKPAFMTIRVALTGQVATPPLFDIIHILGQSEVVSRLDTAIKALN